MGIQAKILLDSIAPSGNRLTTFEIKFPRFILAEFNTHRMLSRNAASSRAIPIEKMIKAVMEDPAMPESWGKNQSGMQAAEELSDEPISTNGTIPRDSLRAQAKTAWLEARDQAVFAVKNLQKIGLHKQIANRIIEPWMHITVIASATNWANFFHLRTHKDAQPEFQALAKEMKKAYDDSNPKSVSYWDWHMPLIYEEDWDLASKISDEMSYEERHAEVPVEYMLTALDWTKHILRQVSVGRCARVSYLSHDGKRDLREDIKLHNRLISGIKNGDPLHMSPFEHVAKALGEPTRIGNFEGWKQYRKHFPGEEGPKDQVYLDQDSSL